MAGPILVDGVSMRSIRQINALPPEQKAPLIAGAEDTVLGLKDVLNPTGVLRLTGTDLLFDQNAGSGECVVATTIKLPGSCQP